MCCARLNLIALNGIQVSQLNQRLKHKRYTHARVLAADGTATTYYVRTVLGYLSQVPLRSLCSHLQAASQGQQPKVLSVERLILVTTDPTELVSEALAD